MEEVAQLVDPRDPRVPALGEPARFPEGLGLEHQRRRALVRRPLPVRARQLQPEALLRRAREHVAVAGGAVCVLRPPRERDLERELLPPCVAPHHAGGRLVRVRVGVRIRVTVTVRV